VKRDPLNLALYRQLPPYLQARIIPDPKTGCWIWIGPITRNNNRAKAGIRIDGVWHTSAPRAVLAWFGLLGPGDQAAHKCPHRYCCRPDARHVYPADSAQQRRDRILFGEYATGERNGRARLTRADVVALRTGTQTPAALAADRGLNYKHLTQVAAGRYWQGV
jgi:hypothetical protein